MLGRYIQVKSRSTAIALRLLSASLLTAFSASAFEDHYSNDHHRPSRSGSETDRLDLKGCSMTSQVASPLCSGGNDKCVSLWSCPDAVSVRLTARGAEDWVGDQPDELRLPLKGIQVELTRGGAKGTCSVDFDSYTQLREVRASDLNLDGLPDLVIDTESGGNGLAADLHTLAFALSAPGSCNFRLLPSWSPRLADFVRFRASPMPHFLHTFFVRGDRKNYWVYSIVGFRKSELALENSLDPRFPMWIRYTNSPNETAVPLPPPEREALLVRSHAPPVIVEPTPPKQN
jgi:hypothetical protein